MDSKRTKFLVGIFVILGTFILVTGMIWLGVNRYFEKGYFVASYFDESVQGLNIDAPVKYRGVPVGRVDAINVAPDHRLIEVVMKLKPEYSLQQKTEQLVAQLQNIGITGNMFVGLDLKSQTQVSQPPQITFDTKYPVIDSKPSDINKIFQQVDRALTRINSFDVKTISDKMISAFNNLNTAVKEAEIEQRSRQLERLIVSSRKIVQKKEWDQILESINSSGKQLNQLLKKLEPTVRSVKNTANKINSLVKKNKGNLQNILQNVNSTSNSAQRLLEKGNYSLQDLHRELKRLLDNLNRLTENISEQPSRLLFSQPPKQREK